MTPEFSPALYRAGQGEPLVLVHGFTATWRCWLPTLAFLVPRLEVIAPGVARRRLAGGRPPRGQPDHPAVQLQPEGRVSCPVLVTWGDKDRTLPMRRHADRFKNEIPDVRFKVMRGLGHTPMWDDAAQVAAAIADFAEEAERARAAASNGQAASRSR